MTTSMPVLNITGNTQATSQPVSTVRGCNGLQQEAKAKVFGWVVERGAAANYRTLGKRLATAGDLFRHHDGHALVQVLSEGSDRDIG